MNHVIHNEQHEGRFLAAQARSRRLRRIAGVTLLELMAVVMVVGILGIIGLPSYRQYTMRAQRTEAKTALLQLATNQERFYLANRTYATTADLAALGFVGGKSEKGTYALAIPVANANTYTATATPAGGGAVDMTADVECAAFSITAQGVRTATPDPNQRCW
jgi:type IV pilus assembly protein PilE